MTTDESDDAHRAAVAGTTTRTDLDRFAKLRRRNEYTIAGALYPDDMVWVFELAGTCIAEREAVCSGQEETDDHAKAYGMCFGDNHIATCPCEILRQDRIALCNQITQLVTT